MLLFLKMNFSPEFGLFDQEAVRDDDFVVYRGYDRGPCEKEGGPSLSAKVKTSMRDHVR